tara:strand:- start:90 stop:1061 length:972 start_codon:yes stop_codon:yes gene_type:complete
MRNLLFIDAIREATAQSMKLDKKVIIYGLGVGKTSNIYGSTKNLTKDFGKKRVFDTPSSESALTAMALGMSLTGVRPVLVHQRFDFMLYSMDQIVNWISLWSYKSGGQSCLPIVIRVIVGRGWGQGPQHSKTLHSWFSHLPGLSVVYPSSPHEAKGLLMSSIFSNFPTIFFESRSLHNLKEDVPEKPYYIDPTRAFIRKKGTDITLISFGPSVKEASEVSILLKKQKVFVELLDMRSLNPIDYTTILKSVKKTGCVAFLEHGWPNSSIASEVISKISENVKLKRRPLKFCWPNSYVPTSEKLEKEFYLDSKKIFLKILNHLKN